ncbi:MAG TPA: carboxypeptidase-like regulatory domain-containing protein, partial [Longimicrobiaceae bacterium]
MTRHRLLRMLAAAALMLCAAAGSRAHAQGVLTGRVTGPAGEAVASAFLRLSTADGVSSNITRSGADGRYRIAFPGSGTRFSLWVERLGYAPATAVVDRADGASAVRDVRLAVQAARLAALDARAARNTYAGVHFSPGSRNFAQNLSTLDQLPLEPGDLGDVAARARGAVLAGGEGVSIGGQDPAQNRTVVDGASSGAATLPAEAIRTVGVVTSTYDVARGQF